MNSYLLLLKNHKILKSLSIIQFITYFSAWFSNIAIYTLLIKLEVSSSIIAFVAILHFASGILQAPISGLLIDSIKPKKLMFIILIVESLVTFLLIFIDNIADLPLLYILVFIKMAGASFYFTTEMSLLPKILKGNDLQKANELHSIIWSISYTFGMAIGGFIVYTFGIKLAFIFDSLIFIVALYRLNLLEFNIDLSNQKQKLTTMAKETFNYIKQNPKVLSLMITHAFVGFSMFDALLALIVNQYYSLIIAVSLSLGLLNASRAIGLVVGPMLIGNWINNKRLFYIFIIQGISIWIWAVFIENFYISLFISVIVGFWTTSLWSYTYTLLQNNIDKQYYGRIVAYNDMLFLTFASLGAFIVGVLSTYGYSLPFIIFGLGGLFIIGGFYYRFIIQKYNFKEIIDELE